MRKDKELVFKLRQEGKSYRDIQKLTGISRATLSDWFKNISWSKHISSENNKKNLGASKDRMIRMGMVRKLKLQYQYVLMESEAVKEYQIFKNEPLFWAGLMIYAGEGDKRTKHQIRISNSDFYMHRIFIQFVSTYLKLPRENFKIGLLLYPDLNEKVCIQEWSFQLAFNQSNFYKTHIIKGKEAVKRLQYGVGMSIISSTSLKKKLLKWLSLAQDEQFNIDAVIV